jgi:hypothetical protein
MGNLNLPRWRKPNESRHFEPRVLDGSGKLRPPSEFKELRFGSREKAELALACLNSSIFYWFITVFSDCRHVNKGEVDAFPRKEGHASLFDMHGMLLSGTTMDMRNTMRSRQPTIRRARWRSPTVCSGAGAGTTPPTRC